MKKIIARILTFFMVLALIQTGNSAGEVKAASTSADIYYSVHCQTYGWNLGVKKNGELAGTQGEAKRLESIKIWVKSGLAGSVEYETHVQTYGWSLGTKKDSEESGTTGLGKRLEAIKIRLTGQLAQVYDVVYRVHRQTYGWTDWVKNGQECGTTGQAKRLEAIQIKLVKKGGADDANLKYTTHCQTYGWLDYSEDGKQSGTTGEGKRLEAIKIDVPNASCTGGITYSVHCQTYGWMDWVTNDMQAGTSGQAKRLEAIKIKLTGEMAKKFDVYYRVHSQTYGWLGWACNGEKSGTEGLGKRLEAIEIVLVEKGETAPGTTVRPYVDAAIAAKIQKEKEEEAKRQEEEKKKQEEENKKANSKQLRKVLNSATLKPTATNDPKIDAKVNTIMTMMFKPGMDNYAKLYACYSWIIRYAYYKYDSYTGSWNNTSVNYTNHRDRQVVSFAYPILMGINGEKYGTCINYASAMVVFARALGYDAYRVGGETMRADGSYGEHYWCVIKINGVWYNFDPQNADNSWSDPLKYFGKTNSEWLGMGYKFTHYNEYTNTMEKAEDYISGGTYTHK